MRERSSEVSIGFAGLLALLVLGLDSAPARATDFYVDATAGDDGQDGRSPDAAWRTLEKVNAGSFGGGDRVLFKRGEIWRGQLRASNGSAAGGHVTYGAYGVGAKPQLRGSLDRSLPSDWADQGGNRWATTALPAPVGNIIFDEGQSCGVLAYGEDQLLTPGAFFDAGGTVLLYATANPATRYSSIELALTRHIIENSGRSYVVYQDLDLRYGAAHGIGGDSTDHIIVRGCDISFIGGGFLEGTTRYGNGIEFWEGAQDNLVERNRLFEIFDAALTNQGANPNIQANITYRNNVVWNAEYCFEYWNRPAAGSATDNIRFENNTCAFSGYGWGHTQRPDPSGRHLIFWGVEAPTSSFFVRNNIFFESTECGLVPWDTSWDWLGPPNLDHNLYFESSGPVVCTDKDYGPADFALYQADTGRDAHSLAADPRFQDAAGHDFHLGSPDSPAIDAGADVGITEDFDLSPRPQGAGFDLGAFEFQYLDDTPPAAPANLAVHL